jgi:hypothetical protein
MNDAVLRLLGLLAVGAVSAGIYVATIPPPPDHESPHVAQPTAAPTPATTPTTAPTTAPTSSPTSSPRPTREPTPAPTLLPSLPLPSVPLPSLPLPSVPVPTLPPVPTASPVPSPPTVIASCPAERQFHGKGTPPGWERTGRECTGKPSSVPLLGLLLLAAGMWLVSHSRRR